MIHLETANGNRSANANCERPNGAAKTDLTGQLTDACANAMEAADAQLAISTLKTARVAVLAAFSILAIVTMAIVAGYGFFLLDGCLARALSIPPLPVWLAPLIRGLLYVLASGAGLFYIWHTMIGFGARPSEDEVSDESLTM